MQPAIITNMDRSVPAEQLGRVIPDYRKTYDFAGPFINDEHAWWSSCPATGVKVGKRPRRPESLGDPAYDARDIPGSLRRADALKLYEMAYFSGGDVIDLGTSFGLSCSIMAAAMQRAGARGVVDTVDIDPNTQKFARLSVGRLPCADRVKFHLVDAGRFLGDYSSGARKAAFVFVDHSHSYDRVVEVARLLADVVSPGGFVLFHDYNDWRNSDPSDPGFADLWRSLPAGRSLEENCYGVHRAVQDGLPGTFAFHGVFGCTALFRRMPQ